MLICAAFVVRLLAFSCRDDWANRCRVPVGFYWGAGIGRGLLSCCMDTVAACTCGTDYEECTGCLLCDCCFNLGAIQPLSAFVVFPLTYQSVFTGLSAVDRELLEMAQVFRMPFRRRLRYLYIPQLVPFVLSSCRVSVGMCWKAGIAGEIIGLPEFSIGEQLYLAKLYLNMGDLFAWTLLLIAASKGTEQLVLWGIDRVSARLEAIYGNYF